MPHIDLIVRRRGGKTKATRRHRTGWSLLGLQLVLILIDDKVMLIINSIGVYYSQWIYAYLIFVIFFTRAKFLENKIYTEKRQFFALNL